MLLLFPSASTSAGGSDVSFEWYWLLLIAAYALRTIRCVVPWWLRQTKVDDEKEEVEHLINSKYFHDYPGSTKDGFSLLSD